jgi:predicted RNA-binding protein YlqC (UPF0109 family)
MRSLLETLARELVDEPGRVSVAERVDGDTVRLSLRVARADRGRVIGRGGRTADALRALLAAVAQRQGRRCSLEVVD